MKLGRIWRQGPDGDVARIVAVHPEEGRVVDLATAEGARLQRRGATTEAARRLSAALFPSSGSGCWPQVPIAWADVPYLRGIQTALNSMLAQQAGANGAKIVDAYTASTGKDACRSTTTRWVEPLVPTNAAAPFHPNARGEAGVAVAVRASAS